MRVLDPGHKYELDVLDGGAPVVLTHVKRVGEMYPGNKNSYPGTTVQEVLRGEIDRIKYLDRQEPDQTNQIVLCCLRTAITALEIRAARRHNRAWVQPDGPIELAPTCPHCLHIGCERKAPNVR